MIRLFNEDCLTVLQSQTFLEMVKGRQVVIVTDPPYNIGYHYNSYDDNKDEEDYYSWLDDIFCGYPFVVIHYPEAIYKIAFQVGRFPERVVSWVYNSNTGRQHRDIAFFGVKPDFRKVTQPYKNPTDKRIKALMEKGKTGGAIYDWWNIDQVKNVSQEKTEHPCQMPLEVMRRVIGILPDDIVVVDPFMGSGTTGVACSMLGRDFIGTEIDEKYFSIADERINEVRLF